MTTERRLARTAGALYLLTHVTSVAAVLLYGGGGVDPTAALNGRATVLAAALLELVLAVAVVGTAVALYPLLRRAAPAGAVGYVALRLLEAGVILLGVVAIAAAVAVPGSTDAPTLDPDAAGGLVAVHAWTFLVGPGLICPVNTLVLAVTLRRHRLVPTWVTTLGMVGAPLVGLGNVLGLFGLRTGLLAAAIVLFAWEISLAVRLLTRWGADRATGPDLPVAAALAA